MIAEFSERERVCMSEGLAQGYQGLVSFLYVHDNLRKLKVPDPNELANETNELVD